MANSLTRRDFLAASALTATSLLAAEETPQKRSPVIDTHLHCFAGPRDKRFPYHARAPYKPEKAATPEHLLKCIDGAGVDSAVVVHPEPYQDDHRYLEHCLRVGGKRVKGTRFRREAGRAGHGPAAASQCVETPIRTRQIALQ
jgi:Amidohydrolase